MRELGQKAGDIHRELAHYIDMHLIGKGDISLFLVGPLMAEYTVPILQDKIPIINSLSSRHLGGLIGDILKTDPKPTIIYVK